MTTRPCAPRAIGLCLLGVAGLFVASAGFVVAIGSLVVDQVSNLADALPGDVEETIAFVNRTFD